MAKDEKTSGIEDLSFEDAIKQLTGIVDRIEGGGSPLQTSLEQYEQGMELIKHCRGILQAAEKKIEKISEKNKNDKS